MKNENIYNAIFDLIEEIFVKYNVWISPEIDLNLKGKAAGMAIYNQDTNKYTIRLNMEAGEDFLIKDTIPHEMAHLLQAALGSKMDHGRAWEYYCKQLGGNGCMYHTLQLTPARKTKKFLYQVQGESLILSAVRHNRIQEKGVKYKFSNKVVSKEHYLREVTDEI